MKNRELIYEMAKRLDLIIEVIKEGKYIGKFKFVNDKLYKLNEEENKELQNMQNRKTNK